MNYFIFGGRSSLDFDIRVEKCPMFSAAQRIVERQTVPGRSGDLLIDTGAYSNINQAYEIWFRNPQRPTVQAAREIALWLLSGQGYIRLEDSYDPDIFRQALFAGPLDVENWMLTHGRATLEFDCKPQRYLKQGQYPIAVQSGQAIGNQWMPALPLIKITGTGNGQLVVGNSQVSISDMTGAITLDCDVQNAYNGTLNLNNNTTITGGWPVLATGQTAISFSGGITAVEITPRWWTL